MNKIHHKYLLNKQGVIDSTPRHDALRRDAFPRRAWERGACPDLLRRYHHKVKSVKFLGNMMEISVDGNGYSIQMSQISKRLASATDDQQRNYILSPSGYGMHWPDIDEDLSIDGIIGIKHDAPVFSSRFSREAHCMAGV